jgi:AAA ATPase domain
MSHRQAGKRDQTEPKSGIGGPRFIDREVETRRLRDAILSGRSLMICGPAGIGKTALVSRVLADLPPQLATPCLYLGSVRDLPDLLRQLIRQLYRARDLSLRRQLHAERVSAATFDVWLKAQSSSRLRGALYRAVEAGDYRLFFDHLPPLTHAVANVIKELFWMRKTPVYLLPLANSEQAFLHVSRFFYWGDRERLLLGPLPSSAAQELLESCIQQAGLSQFDLEGFREEVLKLSGRVPGAIATMCALAADPSYQFGNRIKTKTVYLDYLMKGHN